MTAGEGDGEVVETIRALRDDGFDGFFSLEPHLGDARARRAPSPAPSCGARPMPTFTELLRAEGIEYA